MRRNNEKSERRTRSARIANEIFGILFFVLFGFTLLCLVTHHVDDPSSFHISDNKEIRNLLGPAGAEVSAWLLNLFGYAAFIIPLIFAFVTMSLFGWIEHPVGIIRGIIFALVLLALSGFLQILNWRPAFGLDNFAPGGIAGQRIFKYLNPLFGATGSGLILFGAVLLFAVAASGLVFSTALARFGQLLWTLLIAISKAIFSSIKFLYGKLKREKGAEPRKPRARAKPRLESKEAAPLPESPVPEFREHKVALEAEPVKVKILERLPEPEASPEDYVFPPIDLLYSPPPEKESTDLEKELEDTAHQIEEKMLNLDIEGKVEKIWPGPVLTTYEYEPDPKIPIDKVLRVVKDIQLSLGRHGVRIIVPLPGSPRRVGIEVPNSIRETVYLKDIIDSKAFKNSQSSLTLAMGKDIFGNPYVSDLTKMPHLLVAGTTGSGKSVFLNCAILSFMYKAHPNSLKIILIDPKMLEFSHYEGIPHLMHPVVTDAVEAIRVLSWAVEEMERRYRILAEAGARDISSYMTGIEVGEDLDETETYTESEENPELVSEPAFVRERLPYLVIIVDEFADLMAVAPREIEQAVIRLSQKARAAGIHLILATQRPSVDVITGLIKANFPARISFKLRTKIDSRTILDVGGADDLLGFGDMFFLPSTSGNLIRLHAAFVSPQEIERVVEFTSRFAPKRAEKIEALPQLKDWQRREVTTSSEASIRPEDEDELYNEVLEFALERGVISTTMIQNRFRVGYVKAARIIQRMEDEGLIGPPEAGGKPRKVLGKTQGNDDESID